MPSLTTATLGGGCFWCLEAAFQDMPGIDQVTSGYSGGTVDNPTYEDVCRQTTGHAEVIQVLFDTTVITYADLLKLFFTIHDPTSLNRQGEDVGPQYRSVVFYHDGQQLKTAEDVIAEIAPLYAQPIVTELVPFERFFPAEPYHHNYFRNHPEQTYCRLVIAPKIAKFRKEHWQRFGR